MSIYYFVFVLVFLDIFKLNKNVFFVNGEDFQIIQLSSGLSGLKDKIICENFHKIVKYQSLRIVLNIYFNNIIISHCVRCSLHMYIFHYYHVITGQILEVSVSQRIA